MGTPARRLVLFLYVLEARIPHSDPGLHPYRLLCRASDGETSAGIAHAETIPYDESGLESWITLFV